MSRIKVRMRSIPYRLSKPVPGSTVFNTTMGSRDVVTEEYPFVIGGECTASRDYVERNFKYEHLSSIGTAHVTVWPIQGSKATIYEAELRPIESGGFTVILPGNRMRQGNSQLVSDHGWGDVVLYLDGSPVEVINGAEFFYMYGVVIE